MRRLPLIHRLSYLLFLSYVLPLFLVTSFAHADPLIADVSDHLISIDAHFTGTNILVFGARQDPGDMLIIIRGPKRDFLVQRKEKIAGIWVNGKQETFTNKDSFLAIASSRPLSLFGNNWLLNQLSLPYQAFFQIEDITTKHHITLQQALIQHLQQRLLYPKFILPLPFVGERLFRVVIPLPDTIPYGHYTVEFYLIHNGQLVAMQSTPLEVRKIGFDAFIFDLAHHHPFLYGISAIVTALMIGWSVSTLFRKFSP